MPGDVYIVVQTRPGDVYIVVQTRPVQGCLHSTSVVQTRPVEGM